MKHERGDTSYFTSVRRHNEERLNVVLLQEGVPLVAKTWFHLIVSIQTLQGGSCDVDLTESKKR